MKRNPRPREGINQMSPWTSSTNQLWREARSTPRLPVEENNFTLRLPELSSFLLFPIKSSFVWWLLLLFWSTDVFALLCLRLFVFEGFRWFVMHSYVSIEFNESQLLQRLGWIFGGLNENPLCRHRRLPVRISYLLRSLSDIK